MSNLPERNSHWPWRFRFAPTRAGEACAKQSSIAAFLAGMGTAAVLLLLGCSATTVHTRFQPGTAPILRHSTLAVVPFENLSANRNAGLAVTDLASSVVFAQDYFQLVEVGVLQEDSKVRFRRFEISPWERQLGVNPAAAADVGRSLEADYVLAGSLGEYGFVDGFGETATVGITLRLVRSSDAEVLWAGSLSRRVGSIAFSEESAHRLAHEVLQDLLDRLLKDLLTLKSPEVSQSKADSGDPPAPAR